MTTETTTPTTDGITYDPSWGDVADASAEAERANKFAPRPVMHTVSVPLTEHEQAGKAVTLAALTQEIGVAKAHLKETSAALLRFRAKLSPGCAADLDRFVAAYGDDVVLAALSLDKGEAQTRNAIMRCWHRNGLSAYRIAKLLDADLAAVKRGLVNMPKQRKAIRAAELRRELAELEVLQAARCDRGLPSRLWCRVAPKPRVYAPRPIKGASIREALRATRAAVERLAMGGAK